MHTDTHPKRKRGEKPPMSRREAAFIICLMVGGVLFLVWHPVWITPPHTEWSFFIYWIIGMAWSLLLMYLYGSKDVAGSSFAWLLFVGVFCLIFCICGYIYIFWTGIVPYEQVCTAETYPSGNTRYTCDLSYGFRNNTTIFDSLGRLPIMWRVDTYHCPQDCQASE